MNYRDPPFYPTETLTGHVFSLNDWYAVVEVRGWLLPLEKRFINWDVINTVADVLSIGERIHVVVHAKSTVEPACRRNYFYPTLFWHGFWLSRLPFLESPEQNWKVKYQKGSVIELIFMDYVNFYTARAKTSEGSIIELLIRDIHPKNVDLGFERSLYAGQCLTMKIRRMDGRSLSAQRLS